MKNLSSFGQRYATQFSIIVITFLIYASYTALKPSSYSKLDAKKTSFSTERALQHLKVISQKPHPTGTKAHAEVRAYIVEQLKALGIEISLQEGYVQGTKLVNILGRIKGTENGKALMLLSHYDSAGPVSYGASDAGSGVVTILEGIRAFLETGKQPKNDIIIMIDDGEEIGLLGAELFIKEHPWSKDVGLVLNFEARGSGGPSHVLMETNGGNKELIKNFRKAYPKYPVVNSLTYSVYKKMPNDGDLTVFREMANIEGFGFAFIDDHFDYHTALDTYDRLDRTSLEHQGSYLMPLLSYFSEEDLSKLKSEEDYIFFNMPLFNIIYYPFSWIFPMLILGLIGFVLLIWYGHKKKRFINRAFIFLAYYKSRGCYVP